VTCSAGHGDGQRIRHPAGKSETVPPMTLCVTAAEPDPPSKRRNTAPRHRHIPVREKSGGAARVAKNADAFGNCAIFRFLDGASVRGPPTGAGIET